jgi:hypothetical protein
LACSSVAFLLFEAALFGRLQAISVKKYRPTGLLARLLCHGSARIE